MRTVPFLMTALLLMAASPVQASGEVAGKVGYMSGTLVAQRADGTIKVLGPKSDVLAGDMLATGKDSYAQVKMNDGAQMTLRPNSNLKIEAYQFNKEEPKSDNAVLRLLKGGFRAVTGMIGKRGDPDAYKVRAASATIGIRGTDFSSRLCATEGCRDENDDSAKQAAKPQPAQPQAVGRVMLIQGDFSATGADGKTRRLILGSPVHEGDMLATGSKAHAVVAFRDESRITLQEDTQFHVEKLKYNPAQSEENAVMRLLKGGVRVVTGLIGRLRHDNYQFRVANSTIGIRGTGFDAWCNGPCASGLDNPGATPDKPLDGAGVYVWAGGVALTTPAGTVDVPLQQAAIIGRSNGMPVRVEHVPSLIINNPVPLPNTVPVDMDKVIGPEVNAGGPGLYVTVHDGQVIVVQGDKLLDLKRGETGLANEAVLSRLTTTPAFMGADKQITLEGGNPGSSDPSLNQSGCVIAQ